MRNSDKLTSMWLSISAIAMVTAVIFMMQYFNKLVKRDRLYSDIYRTAYKDAKQFPIYQKAFADNVYPFAGLIDAALRNITI
jgi:hypothetical protein